MELIEIDPKLCIAHKTNQVKVAKYKTLMEKGAKFPPIDVVFKDGLYYIKNGAHRCKACLELEIGVLANVFEYGEMPDQHLIGQRFSWKKTEE